MCRSDGWWLFALARRMGSVEKQKKEKTFCLSIFIEAFFHYGSAERWCQFKNHWPQLPLPHPPLSVGGVTRIRGGTEATARDVDLAAVIIFDDDRLPWVWHRTPTGGPADRLWRVRRHPPTLTPCRPSW